MQNFTPTLLNYLVNYQRIYLPAGQVKFTVIDVEDICSVTAKAEFILILFEKRKEIMPTIIVLMMIRLFDL